MDIRPKIEEALRRRFQPERIELDDDEGVTGYVVAPCFLGRSGAERQKEIDRALLDPAAGLSAAERRRVVMIAAVTPEEYAEILEDEPLASGL